MIEIVTALIEDEQGRVLLVRKRGTEAYMQPGGKREPGEADLAALRREIQEELGCSLASESAESLGIFEAPAANEIGERVRAAIYRARIEGKITPAAEIEDAVWIDPNEPGNLTLAPLTRLHVLALSRRGTSSLGGKFL